MLENNVLSFGSRCAAGIAVICLGFASCGMWSIGWVIPLLVILMTAKGAGSAAAYGAWSCAPILLLFGILNIGVAFISAMVVAPALVFVACSVWSE